MFSTLCPHNRQRSSFPILVRTRPPRGDPNSPAGRSRRWVHIWLDATSSTRWLTSRPLRVRVPMGQDDCYARRRPAARPAAARGTGLLWGLRPPRRRQRPHARTRGPGGVGRSRDAVGVAPLGLQLPASQELPRAVMATASPKWQGAHASAQWLTVGPYCRVSLSGPPRVQRPRPPRGRRSPRVACAPG